ncbi:MAG TPA: ImmA/IrrE family metallo-endopeptidase [Planctomycetaceae bacterium]|nr:ImmA/IrrE family metallo-endopeptidase [Planctomycetaceae bacterium]
MGVNERRLGVDASLDPEQHPAKLGRYGFTLAHEAGHWRLYRHLFQKRANQLSLLPEDAQRAEYVCRSTDRDPVEIQADKFAAALLMPREMVKTAWHKWRGQMEPICLPDLESKRRQILTAEVLRRGGLKQSENAAEDMVLEHLARPLAERFQVSAEAMRIRLENMGLLLRKKETTLFD